MTEFNPPTQAAVPDSPPVANPVSEEISTAVTEARAASPIDPARSAAGRLGGKRVHTLSLLGRDYEREHGLKVGRQRQKQLIQLGKRYEMEHGLRVSKPRRRKRGDAWREFLTSLCRVIKPAYRPAMEQLVAALRPESQVPEQAA